jgi:dihydroorotate dehydrogenase (NAD+) catalytic subunit
MGMDGIDLTCRLLSFKLRNPLILASGIWGTSAALLERAANNGAGAVTAKSCSLESRAGHPNPVTVDWTHGLINAIGLSNPGVEEEVVLLRQTHQRLENAGIPVIASIFGGTVEEFAQVARAIARAEPDIVEVNISCPNVGHEFGIPFSADADAAAAVTDAVCSGVGNIPVSVKLSPNVPDIVRIGHAVVEAGADAITAVNTMPGMLVDADAGVPVLFNKVGGLSGYALKPVALRCVYALAKALSVPIIGTGGVMTGRDAAEMLTVGAAAVGVGSAIHTRGPQAMELIAGELVAWLKSAGFHTIDEVRGRALTV